MPNVTPAGIPIEVKTLIRHYIKSVGELHVLLLLYTNRNRTWTPKAVEGEMRSSEQAASSQLESLASKGLIVKAGTTVPSYSFASKDLKLTNTIDKLSKIFPFYQVAIVSLIYDKKVDELQFFSDAFIIRKK